MIDVAHDGDYGWTRQHLAGLFLFRRLFNRLLNIEGHVLDRVAELVCQQRGGIDVEHLVSVAIWPRSISLRMRSPALTPIERPKSPTVTPSVILTTRLDARGVVISVLRCSLPGSARRFLGTRSPRISRSARKSPPSFLTTFFFLSARPAAPGLTVEGSGGGPSGCCGCCEGAFACERPAGCPARAGPVVRPVGAAASRARPSPEDRFCRGPWGPRCPSSNETAAGCEPVLVKFRVRRSPLAELGALAPASVAFPPEDGWPRDGGSRGAPAAWDGLGCSGRDCSRAVRDASLARGASEARSARGVALAFISAGESEILSEALSEILSDINAAST